MTTLDIALRLIAATLIGGALGLNRDLHDKPTGVRTLALVGLGSALAVMAVAGAGDYNPISRVIQGIVTGIGFLGAGVIMREGFNISGLTTAASLWASSAIGILVGVGFYGSAMMLALLSALCMVWISKLEGWLPSRQAIAIMLRFAKHFEVNEAALRRTALAHGYEVAGGSISIVCQDGKPEWHFVAVALSKLSGAPVSTLAHELMQFEGVESFHISHARN